MSSPTTPVAVEAVELEFVSGSSDKFYGTFTWTCSHGGGYVTIQYGRRGTTGTLRATTYHRRLVR